MRRSLAGLVVLLGSALAAAATPASVPPARLVYELGPGAESCPGAAALASDVAARLGYDPFQDSAPRRVLVRITAQPRALRARVQLIDAQNVVRGERELTSAERDCRELSASLAFAVSVALDPLAALRPATSSAPPATSSAPVMSAAPPVTSSAAPVASAPPATSSAAPTAPATPPPPPVAPAPAGPPGPGRARLRAALGAQVSFGAAPATAPGFAAQVGVAWPRFSLSAEGRLDRTASERGSVGQVDSALLLGLLVPCAHVGPVLGCGVVAAGGLRGSGAGVDQPRSATTFFAALGPRLALEHTVASPLAVRAWVDALAPLTRTRLRIDGVEAWRTPALALSLGLGLALRFP